MEFKDFLVNANDHTFRSKNHILQDIFKDWWEPFCQEYKNIRPVVYEEVEKFMGCGSKDNGYSVYECDYKGIQAKQTLVIPMDDTVELWDVVLKNTTDRERRLSVFSYLEFSFHHHL